MALVFPLRGTHYNPGRVAITDVIAPPYDIITPEMRDRLYAQSPCNIVRIDAGRSLPTDGEGGDKYTRAAEFLSAWLADETLVRSPRTAFYAYRMDYSLGGERRSLTGFFGLVRLVELGQGVYPHEATHAKAKTDRLMLLRATAANTSPIFALYNKSRGATREVLARATASSPDLAATDESGDAHSLWVVDDPRATEAITRDLETSDIFIADGHHRYETALQYRAERREKAGGAEGESPADYVLMFLADIEAAGLTVLPTHRLLTVGAEPHLGELGRHFAVEPLADGADIARAIAGRAGSIGMYTGGRRYALRYRGEGHTAGHEALTGLDVVLLDELIIKRTLKADEIAFEMDPAAAVARVDRGEFATALFLNPTGVADVERVALAGVRMPPKSTYFYPKLKTGFVLYNLNASP